MGVSFRFGTCRPGEGSSIQMTLENSNSIAATRHPMLVPFREAGDGAPLFCFPGAGGNVHIFEEMTSILPQGHPVYAVDMESLCDENQDFTIEELAPVYLEIVRSVQSSGPYYFCGYSFGGLVAYEIAMRLIEEGESVNLVGLLDAANPAMLLNLSQKDSAHFHKTYLVDRLRRYGENLMRGQFKAFAGRGFAFIVARVGKSFTPAIKSGFRMAKRPLPKVFRANDPVFQRAWKNYVPKPYSEGLVVFRVADRGPEYDRDASMGWDACVTGGVEVHIVPGGHVDMMNMPSVRVVAEKLAAYLDNGSTRGRSDWMV